MGRLRTLAILLSLGAGGYATEGARADDAAPPGASSRPQPPVNPSEYVQAGIKLYTKGDLAKAATYFKAANDYRDMLSADDAAQLDAYRARMSAAPSDPQVQPATSAPAAAATPTPTGTNPAPAPAPAPTVSAAAPSTGGGVGPVAGTLARPVLGDEGPRLGTIDAKQQARWLLSTAREQGKLGHYDEADQLVAKADALGVKWGLFDDTPAKVRESIAKARPKMATAAATAPGAPHNRRAAQAKIKEGRALLAAGQFEQAEAIALEVNSWNLAYGMLEDSPTKLGNAARALRKREQLRNTSPRAQASQVVYDAAVQQSRALLAAGQLDKAEMKAREALRLNVVPSLTADRAESVLHDIAMAKARAPQGVAVAAVPVPAAESAAARAEREANDLLARNQTQAAAAKFAEAERARATEIKADPAVHQVDGAGVAAAPAQPPALVAVEPPPAEALPAPEPPAQAAAVPATPPVPAEPGAPAPAADRGAELLAEAKALFSQGKYPIAKKMAEDAKGAHNGSDPQADELLAVIALAEQGGALSVYETALDAIRKNQTERARALLAEVQASGAALDEGMRKKVDDLLDRLPKDSKSKGKAIAADSLNDAQALEAQRINAEVGAKVAESRRWLETDPEKAIAILNEGLAAVKAKDLPPTVARTMTRRLEVAIELAKKEKLAFDVKIKDKKVKEEIEGKKLRILEADKAKKAQIVALMTQAQEAYANGKLAEAETLAKRAQEIDPNEVGPQMLVYKANIERHYTQSVDDKKAKEESFLGQMHEVDRAAIVDPQLMSRGITYTKDYKDLMKARQDLFANLEPKRDPSTLNIEKKLREPINVNLQNQTLEEAITFLQNYTGLNITIDPRALQEEGLSKDAKVDVRLTGTKLQTVLKLMLRPLGLTYKVEDDVLVITSPQATRETLYTKTYSVADLVIGPVREGDAKQNQPGAPFGAPTDPNNVAGVHPPGMSSAGPSFTTTVGQRPRLDMTPLIQLIVQSIAPGTWKVYDEAGHEAGDGAYGLGGGFGGDNALNPPGPPIGAIIPFSLSISLIIRHTAEIHEDIASLLRQLRRLQDLQVSVEVRFIDVTDDFFEQIGVDFDFNIQSNAIGKHSTLAIPNPSTALFPVSGLTGGFTGGTSTTTGGTAGTTTGGTAGTTGGTAGTTGGTAGTTGGTTGTTGGAGGATIAGGGAGIGGGGVGGGGATTGLGGNTAGGTTGNANNSTTTGAYIVNPIRDHTLGNRLPVVVGTQGPGIANFSSNLDIPFQQGSYSAIAPFNAVPNVGGTFGIAFLSDLEVYLFMQASQGDQRSNVVQAPKITTFNGAPATINNNSIQWYIASLTPIVGFGAVAFQPTPAPLTDGVNLIVTPVVSADRRYVRMTLTPFFQVVTGLTTINIPVGAVGGGGLGGGATSVTSVIQLPQTTTTTLSTTVTVPDGGTVLLGGVKRMRGGA